MEKQLTLKRLSYIKQLYLIGIKQSSQHESIAVFSILSFHDSIEMFLKLLSEHLNINSTKFSFMDYWENINSLTLKESMRNLNSRRVNIKHKGLLPAKSEIEISRINTTDFFNQNCKLNFGVEFSEISLINLIQYEKVKEYLEFAQDSLNKGKNQESIIASTFAFNELLFSYENNKSSWGHSPFLVGKDMTWGMRSSHEIRSSKNSEAKILLKDLQTVWESVKEIQKVIKINNLGIVYKDYIKFKYLTPEVYRSHDNQLSPGSMFLSAKWTKENCEFCINFVIENSLNLQDFEFDIENLIEIDK